MKSTTNQRKEQVGYSSVAIFIRLDVVTSQICQILWIAVQGQPRSLILMSIESAYATSYHRLRGSTSHVLTATHHSYRSLAWLSDFFSGPPLEVRPPTDFDAKWLERRAFTQGCAFCSKNRNFSYPLISRAPKRSKFCKFLDLNFSLDLAFDIRGHGENTPYSSSELNESEIVNRQSGGENLK